MNKSKKLPAKKRASKKSSTKWTKEDHKKAIQNIQLVEPDFMPTKKDTEFEELAAVISIFSNWSEDQKIRNIRFLASKYWEYLKDSTII